MSVRRPPMGSPAISDVSASSAESAVVAPGSLTLLLADVHLRSGHHSHLYRETEQGTCLLYFIKHGSESFSRKLYNGQPTVQGAPNLGEITEDTLYFRGKRLATKKLYRRPPGLSGLFSSEPVFKLVEGAVFRWHKKRNGSLVVQDTKNKKMMLSYTSNTTRPHPVVVVSRDALPYLDILILLLLQRLWQQGGPQEQSTSAPLAEDPDEEERAFW